MPTALSAQRGIDPMASPAPIPRVDVTLQGSDRTVAWLADRPRARELVSSVWDKLAELGRAGHHPGAIAALRFVLIHHQPPTLTGRCPRCRRFTWRRLWRGHPFPCVVWRQIHGELLGPLVSGGRPASRTQRGYPGPLPSHPRSQAGPGAEPGRRRPRSPGSFMCLVHAQGSDVPSPARAISRAARVLPVRWRPPSAQRERAHKLDPAAAHRAIPVHNFFPAFSLDPTSGAGSQLFPSPDRLVSHVSPGLGVTVSTQRASDQRTLRRSIS